jgi:hypothetical protein
MTEPSLAEARKRLERVMSEVELGLSGHALEAFPRTRQEVADVKLLLAAYDQLRDQAAEVLGPFAGTNVIEPTGLIVGLERYHFERAASLHAQLTKTKEAEDGR